MNGAEEELTPAQQRLVDGVEAARQRGKEKEERGEAVLSDEKQAWPIGMRPDGTLNVVEEKESRPGG